MFDPNDPKTPVILESADDFSEGEVIEITDPEQRLDDVEVPDEVALLPVRNTVLFPGVVFPVTVGRKKSIELVKEAYRNKDMVGVVAQRNDSAEDPATQDLYKVGTLAKIVKLMVLPDGNTTIIIQGVRRFRVQKVTATAPHMMAKIKALEEHFPEEGSAELSKVVEQLRGTAKTIIHNNPEVPQEAQKALEAIKSSVFLTHFLSANIQAEVAEKQDLLETDDGLDRARLLLSFLERDLQLLHLRNEIHSKVQGDIDSQQREYFLRQQIRILQDELGSDGPEAEVRALRQRAEKKDWPQEVKKHFDKETEKLERMNNMSAEYPLAMNYVETLLDLPWNHLSQENYDLKRARKVLDADHFGMEKVKERILEFLAVLKLKRDIKGPILCLYGPPGVGKTSLGKSIAKALGREYVRMALGGLHDEAEIRGHRRTYIGAMPGRILQALKKAGTSNPVFVLDEIDKVQSNMRGDPASALLEVLDPEQNSAFNDNYLEVDYDLSKVLFIATANSLDTIHPALRDRMEIITLSGYTLEEKSEIAKRHLLPRQLQEHGLKKQDLSLGKKTLKTLVEGYTRESGVRQLERQVGKMVRHVAMKVALEEPWEAKPTPDHLEDFLGKASFDNDLYENSALPGVVPGLAWTPVGGDILFVEASLSQGKGKLILSGQLGDVMKESAQAALSYLKSNAEQLGIDVALFEARDIHIHVPAGATPKEGPSAGITMLTALASVFLNKRVRAKLAMTGEITLRGKVLPVGGIKEKILAAKRAGIKQVILCAKNEKDVAEIPDRYLRGVQVHYVHHMQEVLDLALIG